MTAPAPLAGNHVRWSAPSAADGVSFQTLSHAGLRVNAAGKELVCDPWLIGSCYWRSWWNYPPVPRDLVDTLKPDFIYLTHLHWDHFQSASLKLFAPDTQVLVPYDRYGRMLRDLAAVGMTNVRELRHGERLELAPGFAIRSFHFSPFVTDSAVVIEAGDRILLNANDAKFAGGPLNQILKAYPKVDFCFRSHSSANPRACYHLIDAPDEELDDNEHYLRAFSLFVQRVKPRYAIPFASNNCLLHDDVFHLNHLTQTPIAVADYFARFAAEHGLDTELKIMIPGDRWSERGGFAVQQHDFFTNRDAHLEAYRERVQPTMRRQAEREKRISVSLRLASKYFEAVSKKVPKLLSRPLRGREVLIVAVSGDKRTGFAVDLRAGKVREVPAEDFASFDMRIELPALIMRHAMAMNMWSHAGISKRVHYHATKAAMPVLSRFVAILDLLEAEVIPLRSHLRWRTIKASLPRWREGLLYARTLLDLKRGGKLHDLEEKYLSA